MLTFVRNRTIIRRYPNERSLAYGHPSFQSPAPHQPPSGRNGRSLPSGAFPHAHSAISKLEEEGHILLLTEGRAKSARLTESGLVLAEATAGKIIAAEDRIYAGWTPAELAAYLTLTERYLADLREESRKLQE